MLWCKRPENNQEKNFINFLFNEVPHCDMYEAPQRKKELFYKPHTCNEIRMCASWKMCGVWGRCRSRNQQGTNTNKTALAMIPLYNVSLLCYFSLICSSTWWGPCWSLWSRTKAVPRRLCAAVWKAPPSWTLRSFTASPSFTLICWTSAVRKKR